MQDLCSTCEAARRLGLTRDQLLRSLDRKRLPEPRLRIAGRRAFSRADIQAMAAIIAQAPSRKAQGLQSPPHHANS